MTAWLTWRLVPPGPENNSRFWWVVVNLPGGRRVKASSKASRKNDAHSFAEEFVAELALGRSPADARRRIAEAGARRRAAAQAEVAAALARLPPLLPQSVRRGLPVISLDLERRQKGRGR